MRYTAVFLDWDDTLWDFRANAYISLQEMYAKYQLEQFFESFDHFFRLYAFRNKQLWELYGSNKITKEELHRERFQYPFVQVKALNEKLSAQIGDDFLMTTTTKKELIPYAKELVIYLAERYPLTIISNGFSEVQYRKIQGSGLASYFKHIVLSETAGAQKPDPAIFALALETNRISAQAAIMIGDNYDTDIQGAKNSGIDQIYYCPHSLEGQTATYMVDNLKTITHIL